MIVRGFGVTLKIYSDSVMMSLSCVKMILSLVAQMLYSHESTLRRETTIS